MALHALLTSWGVTPDVLIGHSIGEVAAAHAAGVLSIADAAALIGARGRLMQALPGGGVMLAVQASEAEVRAAFPDVDVAAVNGPSAVVVAGTEADVSPVERAGWKTTRLRTSHAFHSRLMEPMLAELRRLLRFLTFREPRIPIISTVTGRAVSPGEWTDVDYWLTQVRGSVRFADALAAARDVTAFVELGPDAVLTAMAGQAWPDALCVPLMRRDQDEHATVRAALAALHTRGVPVDWPALFPAAHVVELPTYAFQRQHFWLESAPAHRPGSEGGSFWAAVDRADPGALADELGVEAAAVERILPALSAWRDRGRDRETIDGCV